MVGGFYSAFAMVVMPALRARPPEGAAATMVAVNRHAERVPFMTVFFGTAAASIGVLATSTGDVLRVAGAALYLTGFVITIVVNVPLNRRLAGAERDRAEVWRRIEKRWSRANVVRSILSIIGALALLSPLR